MPLTQKKVYMFPAALFLICTLIAAPAFAQSPYVGAAVGMDVARYDHVEFPGSGDFDASGEAVAFSLRLGTPIGQNWGVELGFTYPNEIERENSQFPIPLLAAALAGRTAAGIAVPPTNVTFPVFEASTEVERRNTTLETVAWFAQSVSGRVDLVYLGGVAFNRVVEEISFNFNRRLIAIVVPNSTRSVSYDVGPVVGMEARIGLTDHVRLVPAFRLQGVGGSTTQGGWLLRPSVGLAWQF
jgi:hypothetical protein